MQKKVVIDEDDMKAAFRHFMRVQQTMLTLLPIPI